MKKDIPKFYDIRQNDIPLMEYANIFAANLIMLNRGVENDVATYDLVVRDIPKQWNFLVFDGLERMIDLILGFSFDKDSISVLKSMGFIDSPATEKFYRGFKFSGEVSTLRDGTLFFPGEPIVRITARIAEANMLTAFMLNVLGYQIRILTKLTRIYLSTGDSGAKAFGSGIVRLPGFEQGIYSQRGCKLFGMPITVPIFYKKFPQFIDPNQKGIVVNINHALIKSFTTEQEAFAYVFNLTKKDNLIFLIMIDTYDAKIGLQRFINEFKAHNNAVPEQFMITLDSGDLFKLSNYVRKQLDKSGLEKVKIQAFSNLDEYKISALVKKRAPIDLYIACTEAVNITDYPKFEAVYKMAELCKANGDIEPKAKLAKGKESYPGRKQIFRKYNKGKMIEDVIGLKDESLGEPLLEKFIENGRRVKDVPDIEQTKLHLHEQLAKLSTKYKMVEGSPKYKISVSKKLQKLLSDVQKRHLKT